MVEFAKPAPRAQLTAAGPTSWAKGHLLVSSEIRTRLSARSKAAWTDPEKRARILAGQNRAMRDPMIRARVSAGVAKSWQDPEVRARRCAANKRAALNPEIRSRRMAALLKTLATPEARARKSAAMKKVWNELKIRARAPRFCDSHLERTGERVPAVYFVGSAFCGRCFRGDPLPPSETGSVPRDAILAIDPAPKGKAENCNPRQIVSGALPMR